MEETLEQIKSAGRQISVIAVCYDHYVRFWHDGDLRDCEECWTPEVAELWGNP